MGEEHREQVELIPNPGAGGDIAERVVGFELGGAGRFSLGGEGEGSRSRDRLLGLRRRFGRPYLTTPACANHGRALRESAELAQARRANTTNEWGALHILPEKLLRSRET
jgi:hypothetical protein